ncbi:nSTAND1 domain-containing NTPase [Crossiella sp. CA198]|uniref:nSTAND1 domain-containing NTPase n=1 Tax=Crossiella sp. CA198 TaxID=3455607 RepID=UPI003F8D100A
MERPLDNGDNALLRFAAGLRALRAAAGSPTYRVLAQRVHYSVASLSQAAAGRKLPTLAVTLAYARGCGGDLAEWERRWHEVAAELGLATPPAADGDTAPYAGLAAFRREDADWFFGREKLVTELLSLVRQRRLVAVFGASGAGKSSVLRAGLLPRLPAEWPVVLFSPGAQPIEELGSALGGTIEDADPRSAIRLAHARLATAPADAELVVVVDQFEETFTLCADPVRRDRFVDLLMALAAGRQSRCRVILGVRADFYPHCTGYPQLFAKLRQAQVAVCAMTTDELRSAIVRPAATAGSTVEGALLARLIADAHGQVGALPLLSHALLETWRRRRGNTLTLTGFLASGGIDGALAQTAESVYAALEPEQQRVARNLLLRLIAPGEGTEDTKRRIRRGELDLADPAVALVLDRLTHARLLTLDRDTVEITHEALIRRWPRLRGWLAEDRELIRRHRRLTEATDAWESVRREPGALYRGTHLELAAELSRDRGSVLSGREREFLAASMAARAREQVSARRGARRLRRLVGLLTVCVLLGAATTVYALRVSATADRQRDIAVGARVAAQSQALRAADPEAAAQLGLAAYRLASTTETRGALLSTFTTPYATQLLGHQDEVNMATYSRDGRLLATASQDGTARLWNLADPHRPKEIATLSGHTDNVHSVAFRADGRLLATGSWDDTVRLWDISDPAAPRTTAVLTGFTGNVNSVVFSPDGRVLAAAGDSRVRLWAATDPRQPVELAAVTVPQVSVSLAFTPDGRQLASANWDGTAWLWEVTALPRLGTPRVLSGHTAAVTWVAYSPDGRLLATTGQDRTVRLWELADPAAPPRVLTGHTDVVRAAAFSPDGRLLATGGLDRATRLWEVGSGRQLTTFSGLTGYVLSVAFSPDGRGLAASSKNATTWLWDLAGATLAGHGNSICAVAFSRDGRLLATGSWDHTVRLWDTRARTELAVLTGHRDSVCGLDFSPDGRLLATASYDHTARLWDLGDPRKPVPLHEITEHTQHVNAVAFTPDGKILAVAALDATVSLWQVAAGTRPSRLALLTQHRKGVNTLAFSGDGTRMATADWDRTTRLWDLRDPRHPTELAVLAGHTDGVISVALSRDGKTLATGSWDRTVRLWDTGTAAELAVLRHADNVNAVALSPDGRTLATGSWDRTLRLWDVTDPRHPAESAVVTGHPEAVWSVAFNPDGRTVATGGNDPIARVLDVDAERVADTICAAAPRRLALDHWPEYFPPGEGVPPCPGR